MSEGAITTLANLTMQIPGISNDSGGDLHTAATASSLAMASSAFYYLQPMIIIVEQSSPSYQ